jgi:hypothetical protein
MLQLAPLPSKSSRDVIIEAHPEYAELFEDEDDDAQPSSLVRHCYFVLPCADTIRVFRGAPSRAVLTPSCSQPPSRFGLPWSTRHLCTKSELALVFTSSQHLEFVDSVVRVLRLSDAQKGLERHLDTWQQSSTARQRKLQRLQDVIAELRRRAEVTQTELGLFSLRDGVWFDHTHRWHAAVGSTDDLAQPLFAVFNVVKDIQAIVHASTAVSCSS